MGSDTGPGGHSRQGCGQTRALAGTHRGRGQTQALAGAHGGRGQTGALAGALGGPLLTNKQCSHLPYKIYHIAL